MRKTFWFWIVIAWMALIPVVGVAQGILVPKGQNAALWGISGATGLASDNTSALALNLGYSAQGIVDFRASLGRFMTTPGFPDATTLGGEIEVYLVKKMTSPFTLSIQGGIQTYQFPKQSEFFILRDFSSYVLGSTLYLRLNKNLEERKTILFVTPAYVGVGDGFGRRENYFSASTGFFFNTYFDRSILSIVPTYSHVFSNTDNGSSLGLSLLFNYPGRK